MEKTANKSLPMENCDFCDSRYQPKKSWQRFCSTKCHDKYWTKQKSPSFDKFLAIEQRLNQHEERIKALEHPGK